MSAGYSCCFMIERINTERLGKSSHLLEPRRILPKLKS